MKDTVFVFLCAVQKQFSLFLFKMHKMPIFCSFFNKSSYSYLRTFPTVHSCDWVKVVCVCSCGNCLRPLCLDKARRTESSMDVRQEHNVLAEVKCFIPLLDKSLLKEWSFLPTYTNLLIEWKWSLSMWQISCIFCSPINTWICKTQSGFKCNSLNELWQKKVLCLSLKKNWRPEAIKFPLLTISLWITALAVLLPA